MKEPSSTTVSSMRGEITMLISVFMFAAMQALARYLGPAVGSWAKTFYRCIGSAAVVLIWMALSRRKIEFNNKGLLILRAVTGAISVTFYFWTIDTLDLLRATLYVYAHPVFAVIYASLVYRERFVWPMVIPLATSLLGMYLIVDPVLYGFGFGDLTGIVSSVTAGVARATVRELRKTDSPDNIVLVFMVVAALFSGVGVVLLPGQGFGVHLSSVVTAPEAWLSLLGIALFSALGLVLMTAAFRSLSTTVGSIIAMLVVPVTAVVAVILFGEHMTISIAGGGMLILASGAAITLMRGRQPK